MAQTNSLLKITAQNTKLEAEKQELDKKSQENKDLLDFIKESLGEKVSEVKLTGKLKTYPVCLTSQGEISIEMEKVFNGIPNNGQSVKAQKVLSLRFFVWLKI